MVGDNSDVTEFGSLIAECKMGLVSKPGVSVVFSGRDSNSVAHTIARRAITATVTSLGVVPPEWLSADLANICFCDFH
ncbi:hypothetical protein LINGRAPRIM_LOCUS3203 [Linum grandiflorum]